MLLLFELLFLFDTIKRHKVNTMTTQTTQNNEQKAENIQKTTVSVRIELPKSVHRKAMKVHATNPRKMTFADSLVNIIKKSLETETQPA